MPQPPPVSSGKYRVVCPFSWFQFACFVSVDYDTPGGDLLGEKWRKDFWLIFTTKVQFGNARIGTGSNRVGVVQRLCLDEVPEVPPVDGVEGAIDGVLLEMDGAEKLEPLEGEDGEILGAVGV